MVVAGLFLFIVGVLIGYIVIPYTLNFLLTFSEGLAEPMPPVIDAYIGFVTTMMLAFGLILEFPDRVLIAFAGGVLDYRRRQPARMGDLAIEVFAIVLTPGGDPISPLILSSVMFILFEGSLQIIRLLGR